MSKWHLRVGSLLVALSIFVVWQVVTQTRLVQPIFLPSPLATFAPLWRGLTHGDLLTLTLVTMERMIYGWMLASVAGIALGALIGLSPGARLLLHAEGEQSVRAVLARIDAIEALGITPVGVSPAYWRTLANRLAAHLPLPEYTAERHAAWLAGRAPGAAAPGQPL